MTDLGAKQTLIKGGTERLHGALAELTKATQAIESLRERVFGDSVVDAVSSCNEGHPHVPCESSDFLLAVQILEATANRLKLDIEALNERI